MTDTAPGADVELVVTADLHLDVTTHSRLDPSTGRQSAWDAAARCLTHLVDIAMDRRVQAFVFAGDAFRNHSPGPEALGLFADQVRRLAAEQIPTVLIVGNHELEGLPPRHRHIYAAFADIDHVNVIDQPDLVTLSCGTQIVGLPWRRRHVVVAPEDRAGLSPAEIDALVAARTLEDLDALAERCDTRRGPVVLAGHATIGDAVVGSNRRGSEMLIHPVFNEPVLPLDALDARPWAAAVLGHIHKRQTFPSTLVPVLYTGSPNRLDFAEEHDPKGGTLVRVGHGPAQVELIETPARRFVTVPAADVLAGDVDLRDAIVRVELPEGWDGDDPSLRAAARAAGADTVVVQAPRRRDAPMNLPEGIGEAIDVFDGLRRWAHHRQLPAATIEKLLTAARQLDTDSQRSHRR